MTALHGEASPAKTGAPLAVQWAHAAQPLEVDADGLAVIGLHWPAAIPRSDARAAIRDALVRALAGLLGTPVDLLSITNMRGTPPRLCIAGRQADTPGLSITYTANVALAAIRVGGAVGIDALKVEMFDGLDAVAQEYLGPAAALRIAELPAERRAAAFAKDWTALEAALKCQGRGLEEWRAPSTLRSSDPSKKPLCESIGLRRMASESEGFSATDSWHATVAWVR